MYFSNLLTLYLITNQLNVSQIKQTLNWVCNSSAHNSIIFSAMIRDWLDTSSYVFLFLLYILIYKVNIFAVQRIEMESDVVWCNGRKIAERRWLHSVWTEIENRCISTYSIFYLSYLIIALFQHTFHSNISSKSTMVHIMLLLLFLFLFLIHSPAKSVCTHSIVCLPLQQVFSFVAFASQLYCYILYDFLLVFVCVALFFSLPESCIRHSVCNSHGETCSQTNTNRMPWAVSLKWCVVYATVRCICLYAYKAI